MDSNLIRLSISNPFLMLRPPLSNKTQNFLAFSSISLPANSRRLFLLRTNCTDQTQNDIALDEVAYEAERLSLDAKAREVMAETSKKETKQEEDPKAWKWVIGKRIWDLMEAQNIAQNPRPVHHRIPNFICASEVANNLNGLDEYRVAKCVKVNPDLPQKQVRFLTLSVFITMTTIYEDGFAAESLLGQGYSYTYDDVIFLPHYIDFPTDAVSLTTRQPQY